MSCPGCQALQQQVAELTARLDRLEAENAHLRADNAFLKQENAELRERLGLNSRNSSLPPSSDFPQPPASRARRRSGRSQGAQKGHKGYGRHLLPAYQVDEVVELRPERCRRCNSQLEESLVAIGKPRRFQVAELPERPIRVREYQLTALRCPCCRTKTRAELPVGASSSVLGPRLEAALATLAIDARLSRRLVAGISKDIFGLPLSIGAIDAALGRSGDAVSASVSEIEEALEKAPIVHADETGWNGVGPNDWLWSVSHRRLAAFRVLRGRGQTQAKELLGDYLGYLVVDRYCAYNFIPYERRQFCHAHLLRDFRRVSERAGPGGCVGEKMLLLYEELFALWHAYIDEGHKLDWLQEALAPTKLRYEKLLTLGAKKGDKKTARLCRELLRRTDSLWLFTEIEGIEPTNNAAERCLRGAVIKRKLSFGNQSARGERTLERLLSVSQTCRLQGRSCFAYLSEAIEAYRQGLPTPSLVTTD